MIQTHGINSTSVHFIRCTVIGCIKPRMTVQSTATLCLDVSGFTLQAACRLIVLVKIYQMVFMPR